MNPLAPTTEKIADGVWRHAGDVRRGMNVYLVEEEDGSGVFAFDSGTKMMAKGIRRAAEDLGGLTRVVLGRMLGLTVPAPLLATADEVIE